MKILIITKNWLGDLFFQMPSIALIARTWPEAEITCLTPPRCAPLLKAMPEVKAVIHYDEKNENRSWLKRFSVIFKLRQQSWDKAFIFHRSKTRAFLARAAGCREITGFSVKGKHFLTKPIKPPMNAMHHVDYFLSLLSSYGLNVPTNAFYEFPVNDQYRKSIEEKLKGSSFADRDFVCFHLGANWEPKRWPTTHFARLADLIYQKYGLGVVVTGAPTDRFLADKFKSHVEKCPILILTGKTTLLELGALFERAQVLISGDSGPMHIASAIGCRVAALFGPTDPALTGPRGKGETVVLSHIPSGYSVPYLGHELPKQGWLSHIQPEQVFNVIEKKQWLSGEVLRNG